MGKRTMFGGKHYQGSSSNLQICNDLNWVACLNNESRKHFEFLTAPPVPERVPCGPSPVDKVPLSATHGHPLILVRVLTPGLFPTTLQ